MTEVKRCEWLNGKDLYTHYHDTEWGIPLRHDDQKMFEFLILEGFQAGLSWYTILSKRENFRNAWDNFDPNIIALYDNHKLENLMQNSGIIRNRLKINSLVINAKACLALKEEGIGLCEYFWAFTDGKVIQNNFKKTSDIPAKTELSDRISKDLKKRGFKFIGSTIIYAHLQACGIVNDHIQSCFRYNELRT